MKRNKHKRKEVCDLVAELSGEKVKNKVDKILKEKSDAYNAVMAIADIIKTEDVDFNQAIAISQAVREYYTDPTIEVPITGEERIERNFGFGKKAEKLRNKYMKLLKGK